MMPRRCEYCPFNAETGWMCPAGEEGECEEKCCGCGVAGTEQCPINGTTEKWCVAARKAAEDDS